MVPSFRIVSKLAATSAVRDTTAAKIADVVATSVVRVVIKPLGSTRLTLPLESVSLS